MQTFPASMSPPQKRKVASKSSPPTEHPKPYRSALWSHFDLIQKLRRRRESWQKIADHLNKAHRLRVSHKTIQRFFKRAIDPKTGKLKPPPLGFPLPTSNSKETVNEPRKQSSRERLQAEAALVQKQTEEREAKWKFGSPYEEKPTSRK
jgi:hypothetical protein